MGVRSGLRGSLEAHSVRRRVGVTRESDADAGNSRRGPRRMRTCQKFHRRVDIDCSGRWRRRVRMRIGLWSSRWSRGTFSRSVVRSRCCSRWRVRGVRGNSVRSRVGCGPRIPADAFVDILNVDA